MSASPFLTFCFLLTLAFSASTWLQPRVPAWRGKSDSGDLLNMLLGDGRRILANHMFVQADVYFHSGYYPSVFDQRYAPTNSAHMVEGDGDDAGQSNETHEGHSEHSQADTTEEHQDDHEKAMDFLHEPKDWIERFGRRFAITEHQHLEGGKEREMLPWLRLSASFDPQRIETYTVAAFWLRRTLGKPKEAEEFLREGLKANPRSYEILLELGRIHYEQDKDAVRARNVWEAALDRWNEQEPGKKKPNLFALDQILVSLAKLESEQGNSQKAIYWLQMAIEKDASPNPDALRKQIQDLRRGASAFEP